MASLHVVVVVVVVDIGASVAVVVVDRARLDAAAFVSLGISRPIMAASFGG